MANPGEGYLVLQPGEANDPFTVSVEAGTYSAEWHSRDSREMREAGKVTVENNADVTFGAPFAQASPVVLHLKRDGCQP